MPVLADLGEVAVSSTLSPARASPVRTPVVLRSWIIQESAERRESSCLRVAGCVPTARIHHPVY